MEIYSAFHDFPKEAALVGRILAEYPELEFEMSQLVGTVLNDKDQAIRIIFRAKGEETRIRVMDALVRTALNAVDLKNEYEATLGAVRHCKSIRNQYAHAHWYSGNDELVFANLEESAQTATGPTFVKIYKIDVTLLTLQEQYMNYVSRWMYFLIDHYEHRAGRSPTPAVQAPKIIEKPPLYIPQ